MFSDGQRQLISLDAGTPKQFRMAVESADAVWVASQQSLRRFRLERDKDGRPSRWVADQTFCLPRFGVGLCRAVDRRWESLLHLRRQSVSHADGRDGQK